MNQHKNEKKGPPSEWQIKKLEQFLNDGWSVSVAYAKAGLTFDRVRRYSELYPKTMELIQLCRKKRIGYEYKPCADYRYKGDIKENQFVSNLKIKDMEKKSKQDLAKKLLNGEDEIIATLVPGINKQLLG